jgi:hypothetical protein
MVGVKWNTYLKSCIGNGAFELRYGTANRIVKRQNTRALQERIQPKRYRKYCASILVLSIWLVSYNVIALHY